MSKLNNKCCNSDNLVYDEEIICGEVELWYCIKCKKSYNIPIEIRRDLIIENLCLVWKLKKQIVIYKQKRRKQYAPFFITTKEVLMNIFEL